MNARVCASRAPNGSSISSTSGLFASARAIATRCIIPPESSLGYACSNPVRPTMVMNRRATSCRAASGTPRSRGPNSTLPWTVSHGKRV